MDENLIKRIIEAALLASTQPLSVAQLAELLADPDEAALHPAAVAQALQALQDDCAERGVELVELASGYRYQVRSDVHPWVARLWTERQTRYTRATLETLALIAYRQPVTRGEIEQVRGVAVSTNIIRALEEREWIRIVGHRDVPGKPALFGTTRTFLDYFGLKRLDELPPLAELKEIGELEPQLPFEPRDTTESPGPMAVGGIAAEGDPDHTDAEGVPHGNGQADDTNTASNAIDKMDDCGPLEEDDAAVASSELDK